MYRSIEAGKIFNESRKKAPVFKRIAMWFEARSSGHARSMHENKRANPDYFISHERNIRIDIERAEGSARRIFR